MIVEGAFTKRVPCGAEPPSAGFDYAGFAATWTTPFTGECAGSACEGSALPTQDDSSPLCISSFSLEATWSGCGEGDDACLPIEADPDLDCP